MKKLIFLAGAAVGMILAAFSYELMPPACAAEATLPVTVTIVQCGHREELPQACAQDARCCSLIEPAAGVQEQDGQPKADYEVHDWPWTETPVDSIVETINYE